MKNKKEAVNEVNLSTMPYDQYKEGSRAGNNQPLYHHL